MSYVSPIKDNDWKSVRQAISTLARKVGPLAEKTFADITITGLTASRLVASDADKQLESVSNLTSWVAGTSNQITSTDDGDGTLTLSTPQDIHTGASPTFAGGTFTGTITGVTPVASTDLTTKQYVDDAVGGASQYAFKTITGITNDVVADATDDSLTLASANARLTIVGTTATDTITFTADTDLHNYSWTSVDGIDLKTGSVTQAYDAGLTDLAGVAMAADKFYYTSADNVHVAGDVTAFARSILDDADEATFKATVNLEIGTDVLAQQTIGIADDNLVEIDDADAADDDYAKFTLNGLEGRSYAEVKTDLSLDSVENTALSTWAGSGNITTVGTIASGTWSSNITGATIDATSTQAEWDAAYTHISNNGTDHSYIDQDVTTTGSPTFADLSVTSSSGGELNVSIVHGSTQDASLTLDTGGAGDFWKLHCNQGSSLFRIYQDTTEHTRLIDGGGILTHDGSISKGWLQYYKFGAGFSGAGTLYGGIENYDTDGRSIFYVLNSDDDGSSNKYWWSMRAHGSTYSETIWGISMAGATCLMGNGATTVIGNYNAGGTLSLCCGTGGSEDEAMRIFDGGKISLGATSEVDYLYLARNDNININIDAGQNANFIADRGDSANYYANFSFRTAGTDAWTTGLWAGDTGYNIYRYTGSPYWTQCLNIDTSGNWQLGTPGSNYLGIAANGDLSFTGTAGFYLTRLSQSALPTPDTGEFLVHHDSNDDSMRLVYNDTTAGVVQTELLASGKGFGNGMINLFGWQSTTIQGTWAYYMSTSALYGGSYRNTSDTDADEINWTCYMAAGTYTCKLLSLTNTDHAIVDIYIDSTEVASFDLYAASALNVVFTQASISVATSGVKTIKLVVDGKNGSSTGYKGHNQCLSFFRTA